MDIYCGRCGEPWDNESIHDRVEELKEDGITVKSVAPTYDSVKRDFIKRGCVALGGSPCEPTGSKLAAVSQMLMEEFGDDLDGVMSDLDDFRAMGLLDD
jgi:hypothetical protein